MKNNIRSKTLSSASSSTESKMPTLGGISIPEIAILGAAGFVLWRNREKIQSLLEDHGIDSPSFLSSDLGDLIQSGVSVIGNRVANNSTTTKTSSRRHDA